MLYIMCWDKNGMSQIVENTDWHIEVKRKHIAPNSYYTDGVFTPLKCNMTGGRRR